MTIAPPRRNAATTFSSIGSEKIGYYLRADLYRKIQTLSPEELDRFGTENGVTHSFMTTQVGVMFALNYPENPSLKHLSVGGEKLVSMDPPSYAFHNVFVISFLLFFGFRLRPFRGPFPLKERYT